MVIQSRTINKTIIAWFRTHLRWPELFIWGLVVIGFFIRIWRLDKTLLFGFDQGRDAFLIDAMLQTWKPILIGPTTGLAGVFIGPLVYYLMAPWYWLSGGDPLWPAIFFAGLSALAIWVGFQLGKTLFNGTVGIVFAILLTASKHAIFYARWLSNPSPLVLISLLLFWATYLAAQGRRAVLPWIGLLAGLALQTELANAFFLVIIIVGYLSWHLSKLNRKEVFMAIGLFFLTVLPQVVFDFRHEQIISNGFINQLSQVKSVPLSSVWPGRPTLILKWLAGNFGQEGFFWDDVSWVVLLGIVLAVVITPWFLIKPTHRKGLSYLSLWLGFPISVYLFYTGNEGNFFDYYLISLFIPFLLLLAVGLVRLCQNLNLSPWFLSPVLALFAYSNLAYSEAALPTEKLGYSWERLHQTSDYILRTKTENEAIWVRTPNGIPATYQFVLNWQAKRRGLPQPRYDQKTERFYLVYEETGVISNEVFYLWVPTREWRDPLIQNATLLDEQKFGIIKVEKYERKN